MRINTFIRPVNETEANKILRKGRGAWGDFVNDVLEARRTAASNKGRIYPVCNDCLKARNINCTHIDNAE